MITLKVLADDALRLIGTLYDDWGGECCPTCRDNPWHTERRYRTQARDPGATVSACDCACHRLRVVAGHEDALGGLACGSEGLDKVCQP